MRWVTGKDRILTRVVVNPDTRCWDWTSGKRTVSGYGQFREGMAHRVSYELFVGPIPDGLFLDHLCNRPICVNPEHLEPVTHAENMRRSVERRPLCNRGHEFTAENTYMRPDGQGRQCRACNRAAVARYKAGRAA